MIRKGTREVCLNASNFHINHLKGRKGKEAGRKEEHEKKMGEKKGR